MSLRATDYLGPAGRKGSKPQRFRCNDGYAYVVKLINNPQGTRILANEFVVGKIALAIGAPCPPVDIVNVSKSLINEVNLDVSENFKPGPQFASLEITNTGSALAHSDYELMKKTTNLSYWPSVIVLDTLTRNDDRNEKHVLISTSGLGESRFWAIDHGQSLGFTSGWASLPSSDVTIMGIYRHLVYGKDPFTQTFNRLRLLRRITLEKILADVPSNMWEVSDRDKDHLLTYLEIVTRQLPSKFDASKKMFPGWI